MKDYSQYDAVAFAQDEEFIKWVKQGYENPELDLFWRSVVESYPDKMEEMQHARELIRAVLDEPEYHVDIEKQRETWSRLRSSMQNHDNAEALARQQKSGFRLRLMQIAAAVTLVVAASAVTFWLTGDYKNTSQSGSVGIGWKEATNHTSSPKTVLLSDGSSVVLEPNSVLYYQEAFGSDYREVKLEGEGFFEIAKDPKKPFLVYADKIVTKVLGTSFIVRSLKKENDIKVQVRTGKVSVFTDDDIEVNKSITDKQLQGVVLTPNQQAVFSKEDEQLVKSLVEEPQILKSQERREFEFVDTPLKEVFSALETAYGIEIIFDEEVLGNCALNASLDDMPLFDKMRLICKGVNARFEILDSKIVVAGNGCNY